MKHIKVKPGQSYTHMTDYILLSLLMVEGINAGNQMYIS